MLRLGLVWKQGPWVALWTILAVAGLANAQATAPADFQRGYFLQTHQGDYAGAIAAYEKVAASDDSPAPLRQEAAARLAACREELAASDLARLMPADTMVYAELVRPGDHFTQLLTLLGLARPDGSPRATVGQPGTALPVPGLFFPDDFSVSPALTSELKKLRGLAVGLTEIDPHRGPVNGLLVLHPGDFNLLRGELETAVQLLEPAEAIDGFRTYQVQRAAWIVQTARLFLVAPKREVLVDAIARLKKGGPALATREDFRKARSASPEAMFFAYASGVQVVRQFGSKLPPREAAMAKALLDLEHLESLSLSVGSTERGLKAELNLDLAEGHRNQIYGLIQTAPLSKRSLQYVPSGVGAVVLVGLNPPALPVPAPIQGSDRPPVVSLMDIGREFFANVDEAAIYLLPPAKATPGAPPVPEVAMVMAVKDPARSEALWNQLLALSAIAMPGAQSKEISIDGQTGRVYAFPNAPPVAVVRMKDRAVVAGTEGAVTAAIRAHAQKTSLVTDEAFKPLIERLSATASKAVLVDAGRIARAAIESRGHAPKEMAVAEMAMRNLKLLALSDEAPNRLSVRLEVTGLPHAPTLVKAFGALKSERDAARRRARQDLQPAANTAAPATAPAAQGAGVP